MSLPLIELWVWIKMVKGTKLDVAFLNISINTWCTYYLAFDIMFSSLRGIKVRINLISECMCTVVLHLISM